MGVSRRTILKYGLGGASLLALGGAGLAMRPTKMVTPQRELLLLSPTEYSILVAVASAMLDGVEGFPSARETQIAETVDEALYSCHPGVQKEFVQLLGLLESALAAQDFDRAMRIDAARRNMLHEFAAATVPDGDKVFFETLEKCAADNARAITEMISEMGALQRRAGHQMRSISRYRAHQR